MDRTASRSVQPPRAAEQRRLAEALGMSGAQPERAMAAALLAIDSCAASGNHEGSIRAAEALLAHLDSVPELDPGLVADHLAFMDPGDLTSAIGLDAEVALSVERLREFGLRRLGGLRAPGPAPMIAFDRFPAE